MGRVCFREVMGGLVGSGREGYVMRQGMNDSIRYVQWEFTMTLIYVSVFSDWSIEQGWKVFLVN